MADSQDTGTGIQDVQVHPGAQLRESHIQGGIVQVQEGDDLFRDARRQDGKTVFGHDIRAQMPEKVDTAQARVFHDRQGITDKVPVHRPVAPLGDPLGIEMLERADGVHPLPGQGRAIGLKDAFGESFHFLEVEQIVLDHVFPAQARNLMNGHTNAHRHGDVLCTVSHLDQRDGGHPRMDSCQTSFKHGLPSWNRADSDAFGMIFRTGDWEKHLLFWN